jgi:hypothetical protein
MADKYREALHEAQEELARLEERRALLLTLIENLRTLSEDDMYELTPPPGYEPEGLTAEIRTILGLTTVPLSTVQIRDSLISRNFPHTSPRNLLINVHTVLGRIKDELQVTLKDGKPAFKTKTPSLLDTFGILFGGENRLSSLAELAKVNVDKSKLPPDVAAAIYGGEATDSPENQPLPDRARVAGQIKAIKDRK